MRLLDVSALVFFSVVGCSSQVLEPIVKGGTSTWCESHTGSKTTYCRDFDDGRNYDVGWSATYDNPNKLALATIDCGDHAVDSVPCSLLVMTSQVPSGDAAQFQLQEKVESSSGVSLEFSHKLVDYDVGSPNVGLIAVYLQSTKDWWLSLDIVESNIQLTECHNVAGDAGTVNCSVSKGGPPLFESWHQVQLQLQAANSSPTATVAYDAHTIIPPVPIFPPTAPTQLLTQWGANYVQGPAKPMKLSYDNIKIDTL